MQTPYCFRVRTAGVGFECHYRDQEHCIKWTTETHCDVACTKGVLFSRHCWMCAIPGPAGFLKARRPNGQTKTTESRKRYPSPRAPTSDPRAKEGTPADAHAPLLQSLLVGLADTQQRCQCAIQVLRQHTKLKFIQGSPKGMLCSSSSARGC